MNYYLTGSQAGLIDKYTQDKVGIPGLVLMEKAADVAVQELERRLNGSEGFFSKTRDKILVVAESGNNGGDGVAVARILKTKGYDTYVYEIKGISSSSDSYRKQIEIAKNLNVKFVEPDLKDENVFAEYRVIVDSIFGVGLSREVKGIHSDVIDRINHAREAESYIFSIDIPSGISSSTGHILGNAVRSDMTVTFQYIKYGMLIHEGRDYSGDIICRDIGLYIPDNMEEMMSIVSEPIFYEYENSEIKSLIPQRKADSNKGTYGKVMVVAGSKDVYGAVYMAAESVLRVGAGLVKVVTDIRNRDVLADKLPETMMLTYDSGEFKESGFQDGFEEKLAESVSWADVILVGPGLGTDSVAEHILTSTLRSCDGKKLVLDADSLNVISEMDVETIFEEMTEKTGRGNVIITPHIAEMSRLAKIILDEKAESAAINRIKYIKENPGMVAREVSDRYGVVTVLKDARTVVTSPDDAAIYVNTTGNSGMSTGGSGDVLAGAVAGLLAQMEPSRYSVKEIASATVRLHGTAGDKACLDKGERGMTATDILVALYMNF
ncbi:MAG: NAD(P)H-hydrate dehydratase [Eubacterium sp.]|nr:NAD(P)H-hydrate dehydratase [Eubacterium sp.]